MRAILRYFARRRSIAALALTWSDGLSAGIINVSAYNARQRAIDNS